MWLSRNRYNSLCRAAGERLNAQGKDEFNHRYNDTGLLLMRLAGRKFSHERELLLPQPFEYIHAINVDDKFLVFVVDNGQGIMLEDDYDLFPSDALIAKLKLMTK